MALETMTPTEIDQLVGEKVAAAISAYAAIQNNREDNKTIGGQGIMAKNEKRKPNKNQGKNSARYTNKKQKMVEVCNEKPNIRGYFGKHPYCDRCDRHHPGRCTVICKKCKKIGHMAKNCRVNAAPVAKVVPPTGCYKCGEKGHFRRNCPKLKKQTLRTYEVTIKI